MKFFLNVYAMNLKSFLNDSLREPEHTALPSNVDTVIPTEA